MITLAQNELKITFPEISDTAGIRIEFQRTFRIPDDGQEHYLPPGLGCFPLRHIEDYDLGESEARKARGGIIMPMFQTDALWLNFDECGHTLPRLPVALKIGAGKINAVSGEKWSDGLSQDPQNYMVLPDQPWLDGFNVAKGVVRQFVAMPLGQGYTVEEQIDPESDVGGIQIEAIPMKAHLYEELIARKAERDRFPDSVSMSLSIAPSQEMGLGMGGTMRQKIYDDKYGLDVWDLERRQRCFVMLANAQQWMSITGEEPPLSPISASKYSALGLPWFEFYDGDKKAIEGAKALGQVKSVNVLADEWGEDVWPEDEETTDYLIKTLGQSKISDGSW